MELLTVRETATLLRVSPLTVRRYIASGRLPAIKVGRGIRIDWVSLERFAEPVVPAAEPVDLSGKPFTFDDPLWDLVGIVDDDGPTDVSTNADRYLADAYADSHDR